MRPPTNIIFSQHHSLKWKTNKGATLLPDIVRRKAISPRYCTTVHLEQIFGRWVLGMGSPASFMIAGPTARKTVLTPDHFRLCPAFVKALSFVTGIVNN